METLEQLLCKTQADNKKYHQTETQEPQTAAKHTAARRTQPNINHHKPHQTSKWPEAALVPQPPLDALAPLSQPADVVLPRANEPLRIEPPPEYNAPDRIAPLTAAAAPLSAPAAKPAAPTLSKLARRPLTGAPTLKAHPDRMGDYAMLARACRRAGRGESVAQMAFNQAVLYDNMGEADAALRCYRELLRVSKEIGDATGEVLAYNCIGVNLQLRAGAVPETPPDAPPAQPAERLLLESIGTHEKHAAMADVPGLFIAHTNIGLAYQSLGHLGEAAEHHERALKHAVRMNSLAGESLACAHLGLVKGADDVDTSRQCTERRLQIAQTLGDEHGEADAHAQLGSLAHASGAFDAAAEHHSAAMAVWASLGDGKSIDLARVLVGLSGGSGDFENFVASQVAA